MYGVLLNPLECHENRELPYIQNRSKPLYTPKNPFERFSNRFERIFRGILYRVISINFQIECFKCKFDLESLV